MATLLAVALALLAGCDAEPYRVRFHLQLDAGRPVEDGAFVLTVSGAPLEGSCYKFFSAAPSRFVTLSRRPPAGQRSASCLTVCLRSSKHAQNAVSKARPRLTHQVEEAPRC